MLEPAELTVVAKAGTAVAQGLRTANQPIRWPNVRESLLELYAILDEWYIRSTKTSHWFRYWLVHSDEVLDDYGKPYVPLPGETNLRTAYSHGVYRDIGNLLEKEPPFLKRWRASDRRQAARRSLRTILKVYCPELLDQFEQAVNARIDWINENRENIDYWFMNADFAAYSSEEIDKMLEDMDATSKGLRSALNVLYEFITTNFPLWSDKSD